MDFSMIANGKKEWITEEWCSSPIPKSFQDDMRLCGLEFNCYLAAKEYPPFPPEQRRTKLRKFGFYALVQLLDGDGFYCTKESRGITRFHPGDGVLVSPGLLQRYGGDTKTWVEDSIGFTGPLPDALYRRGLLADGVFFLGPERKLLPIIRLLRRGTIASSFKAQAKFLELLMEIADSRAKQTPGKQCPDIEKLMEKISSDSREWSVSEMAESWNMSEPGFRSVFTKSTGLSPKDFLNQVWLKKSIRLLVGASLPLQQIAELCCPDSDCYYFYRKFRRIAGMTPGEYRRLHQPDAVFPVDAGAE